MTTVHLIAGGTKSLCGVTFVAGDVRTSVVEDSTCTACHIALDSLLTLGFKVQRRWKLGWGLYTKKPPSITVFEGEMRTRTSGLTTQRRAWTRWAKFTLREARKPQSDRHTQLRNVKKEVTHPTRVQYLPIRSVSGFLMARSLTVDNLQRSAA